MLLSLRILLIAGALFTLIFMLWRIRASRVQIHDAIYWILFSLFLLLLAIFFKPVTWVSWVLGFQSPINLVYLFVIFLLVIKLFSTSMQLSKNDAKIQQLTQRLALYEKARREEAAALVAREEAPANTAEPPAAAPANTAEPEGNPSTARQA